jgi:Ca-activated chloride channel homolog
VDCLRSVYENLGSRLQIEKRQTEVSALLALAAAVLLVAGAGLSVLWFARIA